MSFEPLGLRVELLQAVQSLGYSEPTPIQAQAIPVILEGRDILARAQTGTGKTDAFSLPLVEILGRTRTNGKHPRALVLAPTRELAHQVGERIKGYARRVSLRCTVLYGGVRVRPQIERLKRGVDILVATPGRLIDLTAHRRLKLSEIEFLVLDEADRMLDMGFIDDIRDIVSLIPEERRTMLFSATYSPDILALADRLLEDPKRIEVTPRTTAAKMVRQKLHRVDRSNKLPLLLHLLETGRLERTLVFCRTRRGATKLSERLEGAGISADVIHSDKSQAQRSRTLAAFKDGELRVLVATDVAARGLDIQGLPHVINYDLPDFPQDYVHRIGRTGRAGTPGTAISLVCHDEQEILEAIQELIGQKIKSERVTGYTEGTDVPDFVISRPRTPAPPGRGRKPGKGKGEGAAKGKGGKPAKKKGAGPAKAAGKSAEAPSRGRGGKSGKPRSEAPARGRGGKAPKAAAGGGAGKSAKPAKSAKAGKGKAAGRSGREHDPRGAASREGSGNADPKGKRGRRDTSGTERESLQTTGQLAARLFGGGSSGGGAAGRGKGKKGR